MTEKTANLGLKNEQNESLQTPTQKMPKAFFVSQQSTVNSQQSTVNSQQSIIHII